MLLSDYILLVMDHGLAKDWPTDAPPGRDYTYQGKHATMSMAISAVPRGQTLTGLSSIEEARLHEKLQRLHANLMYPSTTAKHLVGRLKYGQGGGGRNALLVREFVPVERWLWTCVAQALREKGL